MSLPNNLGRLSAAITSDASLNLGVGVTPSGTYKFEVGTTSGFTGLSTFRDNLKIEGDGVGAKAIMFKNNLGSTYFQNTTGYTAIYAGSTTALNFIFNIGTSNYKNYVIEASGLTTNTLRTFTLPDATGTLALTSNLSSYLPLAGGTLTGALGGTSATFSSYGYFGGANGAFSAASRGLIEVNGTSTALIGLTVGNAQKAYLYTDGTDAFVKGYGNLTLQAGTAGNAVVITANTGTATFSGNVIMSKATPLLVLNDLSGSGAQIGSFSNNLNLIDNATGTKGLIISLSTGAATFSSSVMVNNSSISNEGLSVQYNQAKTYTTQTAVSRWHSNESSGSQFKLNLFAIGNATGSSRVFKFQTSNEGVANDGIISFQSDGGNVGIGTTSPTATLSVVQATTPTDFGSPIAIFGGSGADSYAAGAIHSIGISYIPDNLPQVAIGYTPTSTVGYTLGDLLFATRGVTTNTAPTERMRITSGSQLQLKQSTGDFTSGLGLVSSTSTWVIVNGGGDCIYMGLNGVAKVQINTAGGYSALSDINKKKDFEQSNLGLNEILNLKPTLYRFKDESDSITKHIGFIAQEVKDIIPQAYTKNGDFIGLEYDAIIPVLVKAIQEQMEIINELKEKIITLESK